MSEVKLNISPIASKLTIIDTSVWSNGLEILGLKLTINETLINYNLYAGKEILIIFDNNGILKTTIAYFDATYIYIEDNETLTGLTGNLLLNPQIQINSNKIFLNQNYFQFQRVDYIANISTISGKTGFYYLKSELINSYIPKVGDYVSFLGVSYTESGDYQGYTIQLVSIIAVIDTGAEYLIEFDYISEVQNITDAQIIFNSIPNYFCDIFVNDAKIRLYPDAYGIMNLDLSELAKLELKNKTENTYLENIYSNDFLYKNFKIYYKQFYDEEKTELTAGEFFGILGEAKAGDFSNAFKYLVNIEQPFSFLNFPNPKIYYDENNNLKYPFSVSFLNNDENNIIITLAKNFDNQTAVEEIITKGNELIEITNLTNKNNYKKLTFELTVNDAYYLVDFDEDNIIDFDNALIETI